MATVKEILNNVYLIFEGDADYPEFTDDDMQMYFAHLKNSIPEWIKRYVTDEVIAIPTTENEVVDIPRPMFCVDYILSYLYADDETNKGLVKVYDERMNDEVFAERVKQIRDARALDTTRPSDQVGSKHGAGFGLLASSEA